MPVTFQQQASAWKPGCCQPLPGNEKKGAFIYSVSTYWHVKRLIYRDEIIAEIAEAALHTCPIIVPVSVAGWVRGFLSFGAALHCVTALGNVVPTVTPRGPGRRNCKSTWIAILMIYEECIFNQTQVYKYRRHANGQNLRQFSESERSGWKLNLLPHLTYEVQASWKGAQDMVFLLHAPRFLFSSSQV